MPVQGRPPPLRRGVRESVIHTPAARIDADGVLAALVREEGSAGAPWLRQLLSAGDPRDGTDAVHALCALYGGHPDPIAAATARSDDAATRAWLADAAEAFAAERRFLTSVVAASGPLPSTPDHAASETALAHQRHALEVLARSDRAGCAIGAAVALVLDWHAVRTAVVRAASRAGLASAATRLPTDEPAAAADPLTARARLFGARQLLAQQRALWLLLEARAAARGR